MYRLLIVEDEEIEREGMRDLIDWKRMGIGEVLAVEKAEEALELIEHQDVDILMTDIRLPRMSGLELVQKLSSMRPEIKVIIVSCMEDFQYAKKAIDLDAYGYLSKPIDLMELENVMMKITNTFLQESREKAEKERLKKLLNESLPLLKNRFFMNLIQGLIRESAINENLQYFNLQFVSGQFTAIVTDIDNYEDNMAGKSLEEVHLISLRILEIIQNIRTDSIVITIYISQGRYCTILNSSSDDEEELLSEAIRFSEAVQAEISKHYNFSTTLGIGIGVKELKEIRISYRQACEAVDARFFSGVGQIIYFKDIDCKNNKDSIKNFESIEKGILSSIELCNKEALNKNIDKLFESFEKEIRESDTYVRNFCINLIAKSSILLIDMHESYEKIFGRESLIWDKILRFDTIFDIHQWMKNIFNGVIDYLTERRSDHNKKVINDILKIIERRYGENLTIADIAKEVYLSMNYTSIIFKKEVGENFTDYLIRYRLEKARQMLSETNLKIYQIGNRVGYSNISHFCSIFKNAYGMSPNEYREKKI